MKFQFGNDILLLARQKYYSSLIFRHEICRPYKYLHALNIYATYLQILCMQDGIIFTAAFTCELMEQEVRATKYQFQNVNPRHLIVPTYAHHARRCIWPYVPNYKLFHHQLLLVTIRIPTDFGLELEPLNVEYLLCHVIIDSKFTT